MADNYYTAKDAKGTINISEDVISSIVRTSIVEVDGVAGLSNTFGSDVAEFIGLKTVPKGVKISFDDNRIVVDAIITVSYGTNIVEVAQKVQDAVLSAVESTTGFDKSEVNVHVAGIQF